MSTTRSLALALALVACSGAPKPANQTPPGKAPPVSGKAESAVDTSLPIVLLATIVAADAKNSRAMIINTATQQPGSYAVGENVPGGNPGTIVAIHARHVDFEHDGHIERVVLVDDSKKSGD
jgi:type II secretory pathway component PulC